MFKLNNSHGVTRIYINLKFIHVIIITRVEASRGRGIQVWELKRCRLWVRFLSEENKYNVIFNFHGVEFRWSGKRKKCLNGNAVCFQVNTIWVPSKKAGNPPVAPLVLHGVVGGDDHLPSGDPYARFPYLFH